MRSQLLLLWLCLLVLLLAPATAGSCPAEKCNCTIKSAAQQQQLACAGLSRSDWLELASLPEPVWTGLLIVSSPQLGPNLRLADLSEGWRRGLESFGVRTSDLRAVDAAGVHLPRLRALDLSGNNFTSLEAALSQLGANKSTLPPLTSLQLGGNQFERLSNGASLESFLGLRLLDFSGSTRLRSIEFGFTDSLERLRWLKDLRFNGCPVLETWAWGPALRGLAAGIGVKDTPGWNCSCHTAWLAHLPLGHSSKTPPSAGAPRCSNPSRLVGRPLSELNFAAEFGCRAPQFANFSDKAGYAVGDTARLLCRIWAEPPACVTWTTNTGANVTFKPAFGDKYLTPADTHTNTFHSDHQWHWDSQYDSSKSDEGLGTSRIHVLRDASLYIDYVTRADAGLYTCTADNGIGGWAQAKELTFALKYEVLREVKKYGIIVGAACAASLLGLGFIIGLIRLVVRKCSEEERRKKKSIKEMLEHLESYRGAKMEQFKEYKDWIRTYSSSQMDSYNCRVGKVKEGCIANIINMQDGYNRRIAKIRDHCDGQIERLRETYNGRMGRIKDYKSSQVERVRDQYNQQLLRIKEYAATQLDRLREQYKAQQAHLMKVLESVSLDNCVSGSADEQGELAQLGLDLTSAEAAAAFAIDDEEPLEEFVTPDNGDLSDEDDESEQQAEMMISSVGAGVAMRVVRAEVLPPPRPVSASLPDLEAAIS